MLIPRYYFSNEYDELYNYFLAQPHKKRNFHQGDYLWGPGEPIHHVYYICSGICITYAEHEDGRRKILFFHSSGSVFPGSINPCLKLNVPSLHRPLLTWKFWNFHGKKSTVCSMKIRFSAVLPLNPMQS